MGLGMFNYLILCKRKGGGRPVLLEFYNLLESKGKSKATWDKTIKVQMRRR